MSETTRINFDDPIRDLAAKRAGYRCSHPLCDKLTIGPGPDGGSTSCVGEAAHIYAASPNGPRGQGGLSEEELKSVKNCIWLCREHAKIVDDKRGKKYPASVLSAYRDRHESRISREIGDLPGTEGWLESATMLASPLFRAGSLVIFGKATVLLGGNDGGKTAFLESLVGAFRHELPERWGNDEVTLEVSFSDTLRTHNLKVTSKHGEMQCALDDEQMPYCPVSFNLLLVRDHNTRDATPIERVASQLHVNPSQAKGLVAAISKDPASILSEAWVDGDDIHVSFRDGSSTEMPFAQLGGAEQQLVIVECAIAQATLLSQYCPTVLLLDAGFGVFDKGNMARFMERVSAANLRFQTVIVLCEEQENLAGWQVYRFGRHGDHRTIERLYPD